MEVVIEVVINYKLGNMTYQNCACNELWEMGFGKKL